MSVQDRLFMLITSSMGVPAEELSPGATLEEIELDSLALVELSVVVQKEFGVIVDDTLLTPESKLSELLGLLESQGVAG
jgi:acyl carrier protein